MLQGLKIDIYQCYVIIFLIEIQLLETFLILHF